MKPATTRLSAYRKIEIAQPEQPNIRRFILPDAKLIAINTTGRNGKIDVLRFGKINPRTDA